MGNQRGCAGGSDPRAETGATYTAADSSVEGTREEGHAGEEPGEDGMKRKSVNSKQWSVISSQRLVRWLLIGVVVLTAREYAYWTVHNFSTADMIVMGLEQKPYVYRALVPWLAHLLVIIGMTPEAALTVLVIGSAIGLLYGIKYLFVTFRR